MRSLGRSGDSLTLAPDHEPGSASRVVSIVRRWHDDEHPGAFTTCDDQPCNAVAREIAGERTSQTKKGSH